ncbi:MAG: tyrosine transporter [Simkaniaceae bacterium]|nr:tyrosine transporter [Simkaniaceae bacterium]MCF7852150.1 tyrosine transporter [Simkaniaceae bacterium]
MKKIERKGSVFGGMLLIGGSCIGSGMLGLPILTGFAGFFPALLMFVFAWAFMTTTALFLVEVNGWFKGRVNFITMVQETLGPLGRFVCWITYLLLFYSLLVAYIALSGQHFSSILDLVLGRTLPNFLASIFFVFVFGWLVLMGTRYVDLCNRWLMLFKIGSFLVLVSVGVFSMLPSRLLHADVNYMLFALPILVISFGFHNMIPSLHYYLNGDVKRMRWAIIGGSLLIFAVYIIWEVVALGIIPLQGEYGIIECFKNGLDAAKAIKNIEKVQTIGVSAQFLALFAILTSFLAQTLSLAHFLGDGLKTKNRDSIGLIALALLPPLVFGIFYPKIFYAAINFAGGICAVILFGILPALMIWKGRYEFKKESMQLVGGGKLLIFGIALFAAFIVLFQLSNMIGLPFFKYP